MRQPSRHSNRKFEADTLKGNNIAGIMIGNIRAETTKGNQSSMTSSKAVSQEKAGADQLDPNMGIARAETITGKQASRNITKNIRYN